MAGPRSPTSLVTAQLILRRWGVVSFWCYAVCQQPSKEWLVVLPQTRSSSFHAVKQFLVWMVWNFSKTFQVMAGLCSPKHGPVLFTVLKILFVWMLCSHLKSFKFMIGLRSPTSFATAQLVSRRWTNFSQWCCADFQKRSVERLVVFSQTRSSSFHGVKTFFRLNGMKFFKNIRFYGWAVLPETQLSFFHGVEKFLSSRCYDTISKASSLWLGRFPTSPVTAQLISRRWRMFSSWCYADCQQQLNERLVVLPQIRSSFFHSVKAFSRLDGMKLFKNDQVNAWGLLPQTRPSFFHVVEQLFSSGCYAAI